MTGETYSSDFPTENPYDGSLGGIWDTFVTKFGPGDPPAFCDNFSGLFCDDFEDGTITGWQTLRNDGCAWDESNGNFSTSFTGMQQWCIQYINEPAWSHYSLEGLVRGNDGVDKVFVFRIQDQDNFYAVNLRSDYPSPGIDQVTFDKMVNNTYYADEAFADFPSENGVWYHVKIICIDNSFKVLINGNEVIDYTDNENVYYSGGVGVACWTGLHGACDISFDNISVTDPFPNIVLDDVIGEYVGDYYTLGGRVEAWDGSIYTPLAPGTIGCEDPISIVCRLIDIDETGRFTFTTFSPAEYAGAYMFDFYTNTDYGIIHKPYNLLVKNVPSENQPFSELNYKINTGPLEFPIESRTQAISVKTDNTSIPSLSESIGEAFVSMGKGLTGDIATWWQKKIKDPNGSFLSTVREMNYDRCEEGPIYIANCAFGGAILGWQIVSTSAFDLVTAKLDEGLDIAEEAGFPECGIEGARAGLAAGELLIFLMTGLQSESRFLDPVNAIINAADFELAQTVIIDESIAEGCLNPGFENFFGSMMFKTADPANHVDYLIGLIPMLEQVLNIKAFSPIIITVTDPLDRVISEDINEIPGASYIKHDFNADGHDEISIIITVETVGDFQIEIEPDSMAEPSDSFTVIANYSYYSEPIVLVENMRISEIPDLPFEVETFENLPPDPFSLLEPNGAVFESLPITFSWNSTSDPNPDHSVFYDLIISTDNAFTDSLVIYDIIEASYVFTGSLPVDDQNNEYFWKVRAHDLWGESTFSNETYSFFYVPQEIPTLSEWGMIVLALLLLAVGTVAIIRRRKAVIV